ncbi:MAG: S8 family serine peptidase, partial [Candidatus Thorarchaeota archaeon]|nr:S8 family serine peptidase [Candidatus Thorarchaeota archaeon]
MSFSNKAAVLLFISVLTLSVFMAPIGLVDRAEVASSPGLSPAAQEQIDNWYETMAQPGFSPEIDSTLASWVDSGIVTDDMVTTDRGVSAIVITTTDVSMDAIRNVVSVDYFVNLGYFQTLKVTMSGPDAVNKLAKIDGVGIIDADLWRFPIGDDLVKEIDIAPTPPGEGVDMEIIYDTVGADSGAANNYDGTGITVGHVDTGADFGNPALQGAYNIGSYDGTGEGVTPMWYYGNSSFVSNVTDWVDVQGNLLTYVSGGEVYLNVSGWDPLLNNGGGARYLYGDGSPGVAYVSRVGFMWLYSNAWIAGYGFAPLNETWLETIKQDWKLPALANLESGTDYQVNWIFQQQSGPYAKLFAPALVYNGTDLDYHLVINWEDADALNYMWTNAFYWNSINVSHSSEGDLTDIYNRFDWDFTDDFAEGLGVGIFDMDNPIVTYDYDGVGLDDFSLGSLCWAYDAFGFTEWDANTDWDPMFHGFSENGDFALYWDDGSHGTATAIHVVGRDVATDWYDADNEKYINMTGIAPGADMISVRALSGASDYFSYLWLCGFEMTNETSGEFNYTGAHMADLVTNSWGWITEPASQMDYLSFTWEILSSPDILETGYPGVLHVFSAGNEGSGYMTIGPPGAATSVLTVGASTTSHWLEYLYGPTQPYEGMASFSSRGPGFTGYPSPDVLAPGLAGYSGVPWYSDYYGDSWGTTDNTTLFSGTSQAAPIAAGVAALLMDALNFDSHTDSGFVVKTIMQSTAKDLGYDAAIQGFGRVDAAAACDFAENGGIVGATMDSMYNFAQLIGDAWAYWGLLPGTYVPRDVNSTVVAFPDSNYDGNIFFGQVMPGDSVTVNYNIYTASADMFATPDEATDYTNANDWFFNMTDMFTFS